jgi:hypothetical protein
LIHGEQDYGQEWLVNRLRQSPRIERNIAAKKLIVDLKRVARSNNIEDIWEQLSKQLKLNRRSSQEQIIVHLYTMLATQPILLIFNNFDDLPEEYLNRLIEMIWQPICNYSGELPPKIFKLILFCIGYKSTFNNLDINQNNTLRQLPTLERFCQSTLEKWIEAESEHSFFSIETDTIEQILERSENGIPRYALEEICELCDCKFLEEWCEL